MNNKMKKISYFLIGCAIALGFTACSQAAKHLCQRFEDRFG